VAVKAINEVVIAWLVIEKVVADAQKSVASLEAW
jgi:hypothetical protein